MARTIKNAAGETKSEMATLQAYFGRQEGQTIAGFSQEVKQLSPEAKTELAEGAAISMGWQVAETVPA